MHTTACQWDEGHECTCKKEPTNMNNQGKPDHYSKPYDRYDYVAMGLLTAILAVVMLCFSTCTPAHAEPINEYGAVIAIYGEALHDYNSMYAIACALRNRGSLYGVYGTKQLPSGSMYQMACKAWVESESGTDVTKGATNWLSDYDLKHCNPDRMAWRNWMKETAYIGHTHFYKEMPNNKDGTPYHA